ncbi:ANTAR domain-containing protein [Geodermatophilus sp. URMC 61]|uniref:ANTAR domain-containing protein n=1 Tax=Geodermatophilus sp. URMC 61 TaxID=3423411 RepID=UPI00406C96E4
MPTSPARRGARASRTRYRWACPRGARSSGGSTSTAPRTAPSRADAGAGDHVRQLRRGRRRQRRPLRALESRAVIDQAKGILMGRHGISGDAAFDLLAKQSQLANRKLRDIAADLVDEVQRGRD